MNKNTPLEKKPQGSILSYISEFVELLGIVTVCVMMIFTFVGRLNIVQGPSMENTLHEGEYLFVSDLFYTPTPGDIVIIHEIDADPYSDPIVKRVIATAGQTVDIDFDTWTLYVDGVAVDESAYRHVDEDAYTIKADYPLPLTIPEGQVFVMGDNRNHSADSRTTSIYTVDERDIVGKAVARVFPLDKIEFFKNPHKN
ncbi:MAG: signal peptidase I [Ruminococcaceae bacterium]|nr:signal peptidase I [Oscillospiraceae bacterium]